MQYILIILATLIFSHTSAFAKQQIDIQVNGMVCDFCAQAIWKVFEEYEAVENVNIDLDTGIVSVVLKSDRTITDEELDKAVEYSGYELVGITRHE